MSYSKTVHCPKVGHPISTPTKYNRKDNRRLTGTGNLGSFFRLKLSDGHALDMLVVVVEVLKDSTIASFIRFTPAARSFTWRLISLAICIIHTSSSSSLKFLEWPKQQRHHEDHYSQSKYSRIRECCNSSGISMSSNGAGRLTGTKRRWHHLISCSRS